MKIVIITGLSGAGKSKVLDILEDRGFYCMDNLPPALLPDFIKLCEKTQQVIDKIALVLDIRSGNFFNDLFKNLDIIKEKGFEYKILFLDCSDKNLIKRFKELRRPHPLNPKGRIIDGIEKERSILKEVKEKSDYIVDTSGFTIAMLQDEILNNFLEDKEAKNLTTSIISFGFRKGIPIDIDLLFDVRFLPNPYYIPELKEHTGNEKNVREYVMKWEQSQVFLKKLIDMIEFLIPHYIKEGKTQLVIGIGCTGGRHRSVTIANELYEYLKENEYRTTINHRDSKDC